MALKNWPMYVSDCLCLFSVSIYFLWFKGLKLKIWKNLKDYLKNLRSLSKSKNSKIK